MIGRRLALIAVAASLFCASARAQSSVPPVVTVTLGAALDGAADRYGREDVAELKRDLATAVARPASRGGFTRLDLRLEYARPNHPTATQLGRRPGLSPRSLAVGGATVTGAAYRADGVAEPMRFSWWESDLRSETAVGIWDDAERAFELLGVELSHGRTPDRFGPATPQPAQRAIPNDAF